LERRLRAAVRAAVRASPAAEAERRRLKGKLKGAPREANVPAAVWGAALVGLFLAAGVAKTAAGVAALLSLQGVLAAVGSLLLSRALLRAMFSGELEIFVTLPAADGWLFDRFKRGTRLERALWLLPLLAAAGGAWYAGWSQGLEPGRLAVLLLALTGMQWLGMLGLAPLLAWRYPAWALRAWLATGALVVLFVGGLALLKLKAPAANAATILTTLGGLCPLSWPGLGLAALLRGGSAVWLVALVPGLGLAALAFWAFPAWRRAYAIGPLLDPTGVSPEMAVEGHVDNRMVLESEFNEELVENPTLEPWVRSRVRESVGRSVELSVQAGEWRAPPRFERGLARRIGRVLSPRERLVAGLLQQNLDTWGGHLRVALILCGVGGGLAVSATFPAWVSVCVLVVAALFALPVFGGAWSGLEFAATTGGFAPLFAFFPVTLREVASTILKINAVRFFVYAPFFVASGAVVTLHSQGWWLGAEVGCEAWALLVALQPGALALRLHERLVTPQLSWWAGLLQVPLAIGSVLAVLGAGAAVFMLPAPWSLAVAVGTGALCAGALAVTLRWLNRADLVRQTLGVS
jgi:hypothetical protein